MLLGKVCGRLIASTKHASLQGAKLLLVQPYAADGQTPDGPPLVAIDAAGAGKGDRVIITSDGPTTRNILKHEATPARWSVIAIDDNQQ